MVTLGFWLFYVYLWLPALTLLLWALGLRGVYGELYERSEHVDPFVLLVLPATAIVAATVLILWAEYNRARFGHLERRSAPPEVQPDEIARTMEAGAGVRDTLTTARIIVLRMDDDARPLAADARAAPRAQVADE